MHVRRVPFHLFEIEVDLGLGDRLGVIRSDDFRSLMEPPGAAAPAGPNAEAKIIHRQLRSRNNVEHADEGLHPVKLTTHILAENAALEVGQDGLSLHGRNLRTRRKAESRKS